MVNTDHEPRRVPKLNQADQQIADELFENAVENGGELRQDVGGEFTYVVVLKKGKNGKMELERHTHGVQATVTFRKGKGAWHDDGAIGKAGGSGEYSSKIEPEKFHLGSDFRDRVLREVYDVFIAPPLSSAT